MSVCFPSRIHFNRRPKERFLVWAKNFAKGRIPSLAISCFTICSKLTRKLKGDKRGGVNTNLELL